MRRPSSLLFALVLLPACDSDGELPDGDRIEIVDEGTAPLGSAAADDLVADPSEPAALPLPFAPACASLSVGKCEETPGCTVDAIGCDPPLCEIDPYTGEEICYACDPVLVCVAEQVQCFGLSVVQCLSYPDDCEVLLIGCDGGPFCEPSPFVDGEEICYGCDPVAICVDQ